MLKSSRKEYFIVNSQNPSQAIVTHTPGLPSLECENWLFSSPAARMQSQTFQMLNVQLWYVLEPVTAAYQKSCINGNYTCLAELSIEVPASVLLPKFLFTWEVKSKPNPRHGVLGLTSPVAKCKTHQLSPGKVYSNYVIVSTTLISFVFDIMMMMTSTCTDMVLLCPSSSETLLNIYHFRPVLKWLPSMTFIERVCMCE